MLTWDQPAGHWKVKNRTKMTVFQYRRQWMFKVHESAQVQPRRQVQFFHLLCDYLQLIPGPHLSTAVDIVLSETWQQCKLKTDEFHWPLLTYSLRILWSGRWQLDCPKALTTAYTNIKGPAVWWGDWWWDEHGHFVPLLGVSVSVDWRPSFQASRVLLRACVRCWSTTT